MVWLKKSRKRDFGFGCDGHKGCVGLGLWENKVNSWLAAWIIDQREEEGRGKLKGK